MIAFGRVDHHHVVGGGAAAGIADKPQAVDEVALAVLDGVLLEEVVEIHPPQILHQIAANGLFGLDHLRHMEARPDQIAIGTADQGIEVAIPRTTGYPPQLDVRPLVIRLGGGKQLGQVLLHPGAGLLGLLLDVAKIEGVDGKPHDQRDDQQRAEQQFDVQ